MGRLVLRFSVVLFLGASLEDASRSGELAFQRQLNIDGRN